MSEWRPRFGTAGVRGVYGREFGLRHALGLAYAVREVYGRGPYLVGYDTRRGSALLASCMEAGLSFFGGDVTRLGLVPTPVVPFSAVSMKGVAMALTASHNPSEFVGVKVFDERGIEAGRDREDLIERKWMEARFTKGEGGFSSIIIDRADPLASYTEKLVKALPRTRKRMRVLVNCANGAGSLVTPYVLSRLGHTVISVDCNPSSTFHGGGPEPTRESLKEVSELVRGLNVDVAIAHDGDADRAVIVDRTGEVLQDYIFSAMMLRIVVERGKRGGDVVLSMNTSTGVEEVAHELGCRITRSRLGKGAEELFRRGGIFATEPSKVVDASWGYWEDGIYSSLLLVQWLSSQGLELEELVMRVPRFYWFQFNVSVSGVSYRHIRDGVMAHFAPRGIKGVQEEDGVRLDFRDGSWVLFRLSGTEPKARVYVESKDEREARELLDEGRKLLLKIVG